MYTPGSSDSDEEAFRTICSGIEDAVTGVHVDYDRRRQMADDSFMVPIVFDPTIGDPLPTYQWFKNRGFTLRSHRDGAKAGSYCFSVIVPMVKTRGRFRRFVWAALFSFAVIAVLVSTNTAMTSTSEIFPRSTGLSLNSFLKRWGGGFI